MTIHRILAGNYKEFIDRLLVSKNVQSLKIGIQSSSIQRLVYNTDLSNTGASLNKLHGIK